MSKDNSNGFNNNRLNSPQEQETDESFVKKVKSRVSGLIPSSLTKWFGSEGSKKAVVRQREDDDEEDEQIRQPPAKRARLPSSSPVNNYIPGRFLPPSSAGPSRALFIRNDNVAGPSRENHDLYNGDDKESDSGESTSGYSSIAKAIPPSSDDITTVINSNQLFSSSNFGHNRSLFMDQSMSPHVNTSLSSRRPSFNASTFGSPTFVDRTLSTQRIMNSPFYNGCTMYGGAATYNKTKKPKVQVKPINETAQNVNSNATLSKTARRILDTLEQYATDVNKMPHPLSDKKPLLAKYTGANPYIIRENRSSVKELQVPTVPDLLKMKLKERLQDSTVAVRQIASSSRTAQDEYKTSKHTNKIKSRISSVRKKVEDEVAPVTNLPEVSLPITTLPKFDLSFPLSSNTSKPVTVLCSEPPKTLMSLEVAPKPATPPATSPKVKTPQIPVSNTPLEFKFADPLVLAENIKSIIAINDFKFSEPVIFNRLKSSDGFNLKLKSTASGKLVENIDLSKFKPSSDTWECSTCLIRNLMDKTKCIACETPKRTEEMPKANFGVEFKMSCDKWECTSCMVRNLDKDSVCVACAVPRQKPNGPINAFGSKFKPPSGTWECVTCMIRNKDELDKCAACETLKPGTAPKSGTLFDTFKLKSDQWECNVCMVRNSVDKLKCAACETPKPNTTAPSSETKAPTFTFGIFPNTKTTVGGFVPTETKDPDKIPPPAFSFGIKSANVPDEPVKTPSQFIFGATPVEKEEATSKPVFSFGAKPLNDLNDKKEKLDEPSLKRPLETQPEEKSKAESAPLFTFKAPKVTAPVTTSTFSFAPSTAETPFKSITTTFNMGGDVTAAPIFGTTTPVKSTFETQPKSLFVPQTTASPFETTPVNKPVFEAASTAPTKSPFEISKPTFEPPAPTFDSGFNTTSAFTFGGTTKPAGFNFGQNKATENEKFNFGGTPSSGGFSFSAASAQPAAPAFSFNATPKAEASPFQPNPQPAAKSIFGGDTTLSTQQAAPAQNGLFSFGATPAKAGFSFGTPTQQFNAPAPAPGVFNFGGAQQPSSTTTSSFNFGTTSTPTFNADVKPSFNFTGGATPTFSAQPTTENPAVAQRRKIRAVRRNPQR